MFTKLTPADTTSPALSTATAKASSRSWPVPSITRRHSSAPSTPANLTTVKSQPTPAFWIRPAARTFPPASTVTANAASAENRALPSMVLRHSSAPLAPSSLTTAKSASVPVFVIRPAATTFPPASTATARAISSRLSLPLIVRRQRSAPSAPESLTTKKSRSRPVLPTVPTATTSSAASTATAKAASPSLAVPLMARRHSSAPLSRENLITVKSWPVPAFLVKPAATTFPALSTATARASSLSLAVPLTLVCQAQLSEHKSPAAHACTSAIVNPHFPSLLLDIVISSLLALHHPVADGHSSHVALSGFDRQAI